MLALEDIARMQSHSYSVKCVTPTGTILMMETDKFNGVIKHIPNGFAAITHMNKIQWKKYIDKLTLLEEQKENHKVRGPKHELLMDGQEHFTNMDFFKHNYF